MCHTHCWRVDSTHGDVVYVVGEGAKRDLPDRFSGEESQSKRHGPGNLINSRACARNNRASEADEFDEKSRREIEALFESRICWVETVERTISETGGSYVDIGAWK